MAPLCLGLPPCSLGPLCTLPLIVHLARDKALAKYLYYTQRKGPHRSLSGRGSTKRCFGANVPVQKRSCLKLKPFTWPRLGRLCWRGEWGSRTGSIVMASRSNPLGRLHLHMPMRRLLWPPRSKVFSPMALLYSVGIEYVCVVELSPTTMGQCCSPDLSGMTVWSLMAKQSTFFALADQRSSGGWRIGHRHLTHPLPFWTSSKYFFYHWYWFLIPTWSFFVSFLHILFPPVLFFFISQPKDIQAGSTGAS